MNELSLFTGAGGGVLGTKLLGFKHIGYVEWDDYCQKVLAQRIKDGILDEAPIFGDIRAFIDQGYAASYSGLVDVVTAGFPCQPFSVAGKGLGEADERNMWPSTIECIRIIRPRFALLENVPGLLANHYFGRILGDLAKSGYSARWSCLGASDIGARHSRKRLWILANANSFISRYALERHNPIRLSKFVDAQALFPWGREPAILGRNHGMANRVHRLKAIGNGQVPIVVKTVWELLTK